MKLIVAKNAGFCFGVERAIKRIEEETQRGEPIYTIGEIIHNPQTVEALKQKGVIPVKTLEEAGGKVAIPSHGGQKGLRERLESEGIDFVDATCPYVKKIQRYVEQLSREGFFIVMVGDERHPEVKSALSYARGPSRVITKATELQDIDSRTKLVILAQTTLNLETFANVVHDVVKIFEHVYVINTICSATRERQQEAREIAWQSDCVIVVGGKNSANTRRLKEIAQSIQPRTYHVESPAEIQPQWFDGVQTVGILGGASTPRWLIGEVAEIVRRTAEEVDHGG